MSEFLTKAEFEKLASDGASGTAIVEAFDDAAVSLCVGDQEEADSVTLNGVTYTADNTKGFCLFKLAHALPVVTVYGQSLSPTVLSKSWKSMLFQVFNHEHQMSQYDDKIQSDKILGSVIAVDFPRTPLGGWKISRSIEDSPGITAVATFAKLARGMRNVIGNEKAGRHRHAVSMEVEYKYADSYFAIALNGEKPKFESPDDYIDAGFEVMSWEKAPEDLMACFSLKKNRIVSKWKNRTVTHLMGGLDKPIHFGGVGLVRYGAEPTARILKMAASGSGDVARETLAPLFDFVEKVKSAK